MVFTLLSVHAIKLMQEMANTVEKTLRDASTIMHRDQNDINIKSYDTIGLFARRNVKTFLRYLRSWLQRLISRVQGVIIVQAKPHNDVPGPIIEEVEDEVVAKETVQEMDKHHDDCTSTTKECEESATVLFNQDAVVLEQEKDRTQVTNTTEASPEVSTKQLEDNSGALTEGASRVEAPIDSAPISVDSASTISSIPDEPSSPESDAHTDSDDETESKIDSASTASEDTITQCEYNAAVKDTPSSQQAVVSSIKTPENPWKSSGVANSIKGFADFISKESKTPKKTSSGSNPATSHGPKTEVPIVVQKEGEATQIDVHELQIETNDTSIATAVSPTSTLSTTPSRKASTPPPPIFGTGQITASFNADVKPPVTPPQQRARIVTPETLWATQPTNISKMTASSTTTTATGPTKPIARGAPCPCGSKHKYKKCCGKPSPTDSDPQASDPITPKPVRSTEASHDSEAAAVKEASVTPRPRKSSDGSTASATTSATTIPDDSDKNYFDTIFGNHNRFPKDVKV